MNEQRTLNVAGVPVAIPKSNGQIENQNSCDCLRNGICPECNCTECEGGIMKEKIEPTVKYGLPEIRVLGMCKCRNRAYSRFQLKKNGLEHLADKYTLDKFETVRGYSRDMKENAIDYLEHGQGKSFFIAGQSGSGKTHICMAICFKLIEQGKMVQTMNWVHDSAELKGMACDQAEYSKKFKPYIEADILCVDDFFKQSVTEADTKLAYDILNSRCSSGKPVIISSERNLTEIRNIRGENSGYAIARRIYKMCGEGTYCHKLVKEDKRLRFVVD